MNVFSKAPLNLLEASDGLSNGQNLMIIKQARCTLEECLLTTDDIANQSSPCNFLATMILVMILMTVARIELDRSRYTETSIKGPLSFDVTVGLRCVIFGATVYSSHSESSFIIYRNECPFDVDSQLSIFPRSYEIYLWHY